MARFLTLLELRASGSSDLATALDRLKLTGAEADEALSKVLLWAEDRLISIVSAKIPIHDLPSAPETTPELVKGLVADLSLMRFGEERLSHTHVVWHARGTRALHHLRDVAAGRATLVLPSAPASDNVRPTVSVIQDPVRPRLDRSAVNRGMLLGRGGRR